MSTQSTGSTFSSSTTPLPGIYLPCHIYNLKSVLCRLSLLCPVSFIGSCPSNLGSESVRCETLNGKCYCFSLYKVTKTYTKLGMLLQTWFKMLNTFIIPPFFQGWQLVYWRFVLSKQRSNFTRFRNANRNFTHWQLYYECKFWYPALLICFFAVSLFYLFFYYIQINIKSFFFSFTYTF